MSRHTNEWSGQFMNCPDTGTNGAPPRSGALARVTQNWEPGLRRMAMARPRAVDDQNAGLCPHTLVEGGELAPVVGEGLAARSAQHGRGMRVVAFVSLLDLDIPGVAQF